MSRKDEDHILHGLHYFRECIEQEFSVTCEQILWLAAHSYADGGTWYKGDDFQGFDLSVVPPELRKKLLVSKYEVPLRYLHYRRLIRLIRTDEETCDVAVTFAGADRAMRLHTRLGRMELWHQEHRDGLVGLVTTIAVACITTLLTLYVAERLHPPAAEASRLLYEVDPKTSP